MKTIIHHYRGKIKTKDGLTPLKATEIVNYLQKHTGEFIIISQNRHIDMRSILGLVSLSLKDGDAIEIYMNSNYDDYEQITKFLEQYVHISVRGNLTTPQEETDENA